MKLQFLTTNQVDFKERFARIQQQQTMVSAQLRRAVASIIERVRAEGDDAVLSLTKEFDNTQAARLEELRWGREDFVAAARKLPAQLHRAVDAAITRITRYHEQQDKGRPHLIKEGDSSIEQRIIPLARVGIYAPGGRASYPSSLLMAAVPASIAGVQEIIVVHPATAGAPSDLILACAHKNPAITALYAVGGAQAIAALSYGTQTIPRVDKIVGPGNSYVTEAKKQLYGQVGIDMLAGPSEVVIVADKQAPPEWVAADLCAQAEHDPYARVVLLSDDAKLLAETTTRLERIVAEQPRRAIIQQALEERGAFIQTEDLIEALELVNELAPEHVQLMTADAQRHSKQLTRAAAVFCGYHSPVVFGDYCVGTNHILPTSPSAAYASPLGVYDFVKRMSVVQLDQEGAASLADTARRLAQAEGFFAHSYSAQLRSQE